MGFFFPFFKLSQNKTELQTEHTARKRKNQEQKKTEGRREWDAGEKRLPTVERKHKQWVELPREYDGVSSPRAPGQDRLSKIPENSSLRPFLFSFFSLLLCVCVRVYIYLFILKRNKAPRKPLHGALGLSWLRGWVAVSTSGKCD